MKIFKTPIIMIALAITFIIGSSTLFIVPQFKSAIVLQFGRAVDIHTAPGLKLKLPFIQEVIQFDNRLLHFNLPAVEVNTNDQKPFVVDLYVRYRIQDNLDFLKTVGADINLVENRLQTIVLDFMQEVIGRFPPELMRSSKRAEVMHEIYLKVREVSRKFGIDVVDLRIIRADLPKETGEAVFNRMESERVQAAKLIRAEGEEAGAKIRAGADRDRTVILAKATKEAETLKGEGQAEASATYAKAYSKDPNFYELLRSLDAYEEALPADNTTIVIDPRNTEFFKYFSPVQK